MNLKHNLYTHKKKMLQKTLIITVVGTKLETKYYFFLYLKLYFGPNFGGTCV